MENQKNNKGAIALLIVIIIILSALCILFATGTISFNSNKVNDNDINENINDANNEENLSDNNSNDEHDSEQNENISIFPIKTGKTIKFYKMVEGYSHANDYKNEKEISTYTCTGEECGYCSSYTICSAIYELGNNLIALYDYSDGEKATSSNGRVNPSKLILWNVIKGKEIARYNDIVSAYQLSSSRVANSNGAKYIILENKNNQTAIVDLKGNYIKKYSDKKYVITSYEGKMIDKSSYLVENNMIVTINNNKKGIENITKDKTLVSHKYDEIVLYDSSIAVTNEDMQYDIPELYAGKYFKAKTGNKWSLYSINTGKKVIDKDYDRIYLLDENTIAVYNDGYISFVDYKGNNVGNDKIKVSSLFGVMPKIPEGIRFFIGNSAVEISIIEGNIDDYTNYSYEYNLTTKKLKKIS